MRFVMNIDYTVTALMFPAIPLTMSIYTNRFHTLSSLIRKLHDEYIFEKHIPSEWEKQLLNLNGRIKLLRYSIFCASFGFLWLSTVPATSGIVAHIFGTKYLGLLYGIVFLSHQIGSFFGAYLGGLFYDLYGSYDYAWYLAIALSVFAGIIHLPIIEKPVNKLATI